MISRTNAFSVAIVIVSLAACPTVTQGTEISLFAERRRTTSSALSPSVAQREILEVSRALGEIAQDDSLARIHLYYQLKDRVNLNTDLVLPILLDCLAHEQEYVRATCIDLFPSLSPEAYSGVREHLASIISGVTESDVVKRECIEALASMPPLEGEVLAVLAGVVENATLSTDLRLRTGCLLLDSLNPVVALELLSTVPNSCLDSADAAAFDFMVTDMLSGKGFDSWAEWNEAARVGRGILLRAMREGSTQGRLDSLERLFGCIRPYFIVWTTSDTVEADPQLLAVLEDLAASDSDEEVRSRAQGWIDLIVEFFGSAEKKAELKAELGPQL